MIFRIFVTRRPVGVAANEVGNGNSPTAPNHDSQRKRDSTNFSPTLFSFILGGGEATCASRIKAELGRIKHREGVTLEITSRQENRVFTPAERATAAAIYTIYTISARATSFAPTVSSRISISTVTKSEQHDVQHVMSRAARSVPLS